MSDPLSYHSDKASEDPPNPVVTRERQVMRV